MTVIYECFNLADKILQKQKVDLQKIYRLSNFVISSKIDQERILYNNFTKKMVLLSQEEEMALKENTITYRECVKELIENWFLVPIGHDELKTCEQIFRISKLCEDSSYINNYIILTTTDCNARCFYCYEHGVTRTNMNEQTAKDVVAYILKRSSGKPVTIKWFGGEPLYNSKAIDIICNGLRIENIKFVTHMTSNAYLFSDNIVDRAKNNWNMKHVQITLDGTEAMYNKVKSYIYQDNNSPFKIVTDNIERLLKNNIEVTIRINMTEESKKDIYELIDFIDVRYSDKEKLNVYVANLFDLEHKQSADIIKKMYDEYFEIDKYLVEKKLRKYNIQAWNTLNRGCMAQNDKSVVISPTGQLGKCEHFSEGEKMFGSIYSDSIDINAVNYWHEHKRLDACNSCVAYPNCYGVSNCPSYSQNCEIAEKRLKLYNIEMSMRAKYFEYKNLKYCKS